MSQLVSILIPAYNCEKWIAETIDSALSQTWPNKEIIIVNDGSTDNTLQIAKQFESKSVKVISQENKGAAAARNRAFEHAQGDYIQWLDADDLLAPGKIAEQMKIAGNGKTDLTLYTSPFGTFYWHTERAIFASNTLWQDLTPVEWMIRRFTENLWMHPGVWLISRALAEKAGPWDERLSLNDDGEYISRVVAASENVKFVNNAICYYRQWSYTQLSRQSNRKAIESHYLSTITSIQSLKLLEDSERTRSAILKALSRLYCYIYPDHLDLCNHIENLIFEMDGQVVVPVHSWKLEIMKKLFGLKRAKRIIIKGRKFRFFLATIDDKYSIMPKGKPKSKIE